MPRTQRKADADIDADVLADPPRLVEARFELAAIRIADRWLHTGAVRVSVDDFRIAREFLAHEGWDAEEVPGVQVSVRGPGEGVESMSREEVVMIALRRLATRAERRRRRLALAPPVAVEPPAAAPGLALLSATGRSAGAPSSWGSTASRA